MSRISPESSLIARRPTGLFILALLALLPLPAAGEYTFDWILASTGEGTAHVRGAGVGADGSAAVTGFFRGRVGFGATVLEHRTHHAAFVGRVNAGGTVLWAHQMGGEWEAEGNGAAVDGDGNVWVSGDFLTNVDFGGGRVLVSEGGGGTSDGFLAKYSPAGALLQLVHFAGPLNFFAGPLDVDGAGNVYLAASYTGDVPIAGSDVRLAGDPSVHTAVIKLDRDGRVLWARTGSGNSVPAGLAVDAAGSAVVTGTFHGDAVFDGMTITAPGGGPQDIYVARYGADGTLNLLLGTGGEGFQRASGVALGAGGEITLAGQFDGFTAAVFGEILATVRPGGLFVARLAADGTRLWVRPVETEGWSFINDVAVEADGDALLGGTFSESIRAGGLSLSGAPDPHGGFLARLDAAGEPRDLQAFAASEGQSVVSVQALGGGRALVAGSFGGEFRAGGRTLEAEGLGAAFVAAVSPGIPPVRADRFEGDEPAELAAWGPHIHWRCPESVRRRSGDPDLACPGIFENGPAPKGSEDIFVMEIDDLSLGAGGDVDRFAFALPDLADARHGDEHADIRPEVPPFRASEPQPLSECDAVEREDFGPAGRPNNIFVTTAGRLTVTVVPRINAAADVPLSLRDERVRIFRGTESLESVTSVVRGAVVLECPESRHGLRTVSLSIGERGTPRPGGAAGGYSLRIEYRIDARRGIPEWVLSFNDERFGRLIRPLLCRAAGGGSAGMFPDCGGIPPVFEAMHPRFPVPDCIADGPGCMDLAWFEWTDTRKPFDLGLSLAPGMSVAVLDAERRVLAEAKAGPSGKGAQRAGLTALHATLKPGMHFLRIQGPPARIAGGLGLAAPVAERGPGGVNLVVMGVLLALAAALILVLVARFRRRAFAPQRPAPRPVPTGEES